MTITIDEQIQELRRELAMRERVYAKWIDAGTMQPSAAHKQVARMRATLSLLTELQEISRSPLFNGDSEMMKLARLRDEEGLS